MKFGPADENEALIFAVEELRADIQYDMLRSMKQAGMSQADLARKLKVSQAWVSQALGDEANLTVETIAKIFLALGAQCKWQSAPASERIVKPVAASPDEWEEFVSLSKVTEAVERRSHNTTRQLMTLIANNCRGAKPVLVGNDNVSHSVETARRAEFA